MPQTDAVSLYRAEKARHFAKLEPLFREIRARLEITTPLNTIAQRNIARRKHPKCDQRVANAEYWAANRDRLMAKQRERRGIRIAR